MKFYIGGLLMWKPESVEGKMVPAHTPRLCSEEYKEMIEHVEHCPSCQVAHEEFLSFLQHLPAEERDKVNDALLRHIEKGGLHERFIARARAEGIQFSGARENRRGEAYRQMPRVMRPFRWAAAGVVIGVMTMTMGYHILHRGARPSPATETQALEKTSLTAQVENIHRLEARLMQLQATIEASKKTISSLQDENATMTFRVGVLEDDLRTSRAQKQALHQSLFRLSNLNTQLATQNDQNAQLLAWTNGELEETRARSRQVETEIEAQRAQVGALSEQLKSQTASLDHDRELLAAGRDITDLIGARDLHIIDVHDGYGRGKSRKAFGRIFYTEGKSLVFYAYDLDDRKVASRNYAFKVWGERLGEPGSVRELGILYTDDKDEKRWTVHVDDPQQLAEINSVFVTLQRHEAGDKPLGQKILFAFLGGKANHP